MVNSEWSDGEQIYLLFTIYQFTRRQAAKAVAPRQKPRAEQRGAFLEPYSISLAGKTRRAV